MDIMIRIDHEVKGWPIAKPYFAAAGFERRDVIACLMREGWAKADVDLNGSKLNKFQSEIRKILIYSVKKIPAVCEALFNVVAKPTRGVNWGHDATQLDAETLAQDSCSKDLKAWIARTPAYGATRPQDTKYPTVGGGVTHRDFAQFLDNQGELGQVCFITVQTVFYQTIVSYVSFYRLNSMYITVFSVI